MASGRRRVHASCRTRRSLGIEPRAKREEWAGRVVGKVEYPAPSMRVWYNPKRTVPRLPGQHLFSYRKPGCPLKHIPAALLSKAVRHSLLAKLTIPITTVKSAHTAMIVWGSIGFSDLSKPPERRSTEPAYYSMLYRRAPIDDWGSVSYTHLTLPTTERV